jgi:hypothetical protein
MHVCTVIARNFLAHARVLATSLAEHDPDAGCSVLIVDGGQELDAHEPFAVLTPGDIGIDERELARRATMYDARGLVSSMKPRLLSALIARERGAVLLLDADGCIYESLAEIGDLAAAHSLVLSPHLHEPAPLGAEIGIEQIVLKAGVMNGGLVGVAPGAEPFLDWWARRTERHCIEDASRGLLLAQLWLTLAPVLFEHHILTDRGCNVMGWNLYSRDILWAQERARIDGVPLRHFHFLGGFDPEHPERLSPDRRIDPFWPPIEQRPGAARLARDYAARLLTAGFHETRAWARTHSRLVAGASLEPWMRAAYRSALMAAERGGTDEPPNPIEHGEAAFNRWLDSLPTSARWVHLATPEEQLRAELATLRSEHQALQQDHQAMAFRFAALGESHELLEREHLALRQTHLAPQQADRDSPAT